MVTLLHIIFGIQIGVHRNFDSIHYLIVVKLSNQAGEKCDIDTSFCVILSHIMSKLQIRVMRQRERI